MFSAVLFSSDRGAARLIEEAARASEEVCIYNALYAFPSSYELLRMLETFKPDIVFIEIGQNGEGPALAQAARVIRPDAAIIGFSPSGQEEDLIHARGSGIQEILCSPLTPGNFGQTLIRAMRQARPPLEENLLAFLPAKAGSGSTTIGLNVAGCLANDLDQKALLMEADLRSGLISVLLKLRPGRSILDALEHADLLDGTLWSRIVMHAHGLDLLLSPRPTDSVMVSWANYHRLLQFAKARYDSIVVDLPEVVNEATVEIVRRARKIFVVTTPELPSLVLARQRQQELVARGVSPDRVGFVLNRWTKDDAGLEQITKFLETPLAAVLQNEYHSVRRAIQEGRLIGRKSELGRTLSAFASRLAGATAKSSKRSPSFLESLLSKAAATTSE